MQNNQSRIYVAAGIIVVLIAAVVIIGANGNLFGTAVSQSGKGGGSGGQGQGQSNGNSNGNSGGGSNGSTNGNANGSANASGNGNANGNGNGNANGNGNGNANGNGNGKGGGNETPIPNATEINGHKYVICHIPPGNPANAHTIIVDEHSLKAHLGHGDTMGPCPQSTSPATPAPTQSGTKSVNTCGTLKADGSLDLAGCGVDNNPPPARPPFVAITPGQAQCVDWVLYHSNQPGPWNVFRLGSDKKAIDVSNGTGTGVTDMSPSRSPDGQYVAFTTNRDNNWEIYLAASDGSMSERLTFTTTAANLAPMWSPDGTKVAFESTRSGSRDLFMVDVTSGDESRVTTDPANEVNPFWSADSSKLLYQSDKSGLWQIYLFDTASGATTSLSDGKGNDQNPQFSPDGKMIAFRSYRDGNSVIYTMKADGTSLKQISDPKGNAANQSWSPDSKLLAYQSDLNNGLNVYAYELASGKTRQVTGNNAKNYAPTWLCNGDTLVFTSEQGSKPDIFQVAALPIDAAPATASQLTQLTSGQATNRYPENTPPVEDASNRGNTANPVKS